MKRQKIQKWLDKYGFDLKCVYGQELAYLPYDTITIPHKYDDYADKIFIDFLTENGYKEKFNAKTMSILHEIGHSQTVDLFDNVEWENEFVHKELLFTIIDDDEQALRTYWNTPTELSANLWAIMYARTNKEKVAELEEMVA